MCDTPLYCHFMTQIYNDQIDAVLPPAKATYRIYSWSSSRGGM